MQPLYPWLNQDWKKLLSLLENSTMPHAILLSGDEGIGKERLALQLSAYLLCEAPSSTAACGHCSACLLLQAGTHPDLVNVYPEQSGKAIKVDQVREVNRFISQTAQQGGSKVVLLNPADALNINAANALLKSLEEPSRQSYFILVSHQKSQILPTIRSRCNRYEIARPVRREASEWLLGRLSNETQIELLLDLAHDAPLKALAMAETGYLEQRQMLFAGFSDILDQTRYPMEVAKQWQDMELLLILNWVIACLTDFVKLRLTGDESLLINKDYKVFFLTIIQQVLLNELYLYLDKLIELKQALLSGNNPNKLLTLEDLLINWLRCISRL